MSDDIKQLEKANETVNKDIGTYSPNFVTRFKLTQFYKSHAAKALFTDIADKSSKLFSKFDKTLSLVEIESVFPEISTVKDVQFFVIYKFTVGKTMLPIKTKHFVNDIEKYSSFPTDYFMINPTKLQKYIDDGRVLTKLDSAFKTISVVLQKNAILEEKEKLEKLVKPVSEVKTRKPRAKKTTTATKTSVKPKPAVKKPTKPRVNKI